MGGQDMLCLQLLLDLGQTAPIQVALIDLSDDLRFFRYDLRLSIRAFPIPHHILEMNLSRLHSLPDTPGNIFAEGFRLRLGKAAE